MLTPELVKELAPRALGQYVVSLSSDKGWETLSKYKITQNLDQLSGFLANAFHETGGLTILRESLNYKTPARLRAVWPSRFGRKSDEELLALCNNERGLAKAVYSGRMGNRTGTDDGYIFRGAGYLQTTGREDFIKYGKLCGIDFSTDPPPSTDDADALLVMAAAEWADGRCNELCSGGKFDGACAVINVGNAQRIGAVVGLDERRKWFKRLNQVFDKYDGVLDAPPPPPASAQPAPAPGDTAPESAPMRGMHGRPTLRRKATSRSPQQRHWYDFITRWFRPGEEKLEEPLVIRHPELAQLGETRGDPSYVHFTDKD